MPIRNILLLLLVAGAKTLSAAVDEATAEKALRRVIQGLEFRVAPGSQPMLNLGKYGGPGNVLESVTWGAPYEESFDGAPYKVFVADAVVSTYHGRYRTKVGIGLAQKGDQTFYVQAFEPEARRIEPTPEDMLRQKKAQERSRLFGAGIKAAIQKNGDAEIGAISPAYGLTFTIVSEYFASPDNRYYYDPFVLDIKRANERAFRIPFEIDHLTAFKEMLGKYVEWAGVAKENSVTAYEKYIGGLFAADSLSDKAVRLAFNVSDDGIPTLVLTKGYGPEPKPLRLSSTEVEAFIRVIDRIEEHVARIFKLAEEEADKMASAQAKKEDLFK